MYLHNEKDGGFFDLDYLPFYTIEDGLITQRGKEDEHFYSVYGQATMGQSIRLAWFKTRDIAESLLNFIVLVIREQDYSSVIHISKEGSIWRVGKDAP